MAIKLPKYQRQVSPSAQAGGQRGDIGSAGQEWRDIGKIGSQVVGIAKEVVDYKNRKKQADAVIAEKMSQQKDDVLVSDYNNTYNKQKSEKELFIQTRLAQGLTTTPEDLAEKNQSWDDVRSSLVSEMSQGKQEKYFNDSQYQSSIISDTDSTDHAIQQIKDNKEKFAQNMNAMYIDGRNELADLSIDQAEWLSEGDRNTLKEEGRVVAEGVQKKAREDLMYQNAASHSAKTISQIDEQLAGKSVTYEGADVAELTATRSFAKAQLVEDQIEAFDNLYDVNSSYNKMSRDEKLKELDAMRERKEISAKSYKSEVKQVNQKTMRDVTPLDNQNYLKDQASLHAASATGNPEDMAKVLDEIMGRNYPSMLRDELYKEARDIADPTSSINSAGFALADKTLEGLAMNGIDGEPYIASRPFFGFGTETREAYTEDAREALAEVELAKDKRELRTWIRSQEKPPTDTQIAQQAYVIGRQTAMDNAWDRIPTQIQFLREDAELGAQQEPEVQQEEAPPEEVSGPEVGTVVDGFKFTGGDPSDQTSWEAVGE